MRIRKSLGLSLAVLAVGLSGCASSDAADGGASSASEAGAGPATEADGGDASTEVNSEAPEEAMPFVFGFGQRVPTPEHASWYAVAQAMGYWEDEGLDVEMRLFDGGTTVVQAIETNQVDAGLVGTASLIGAAAVGSDVVGYFTDLTGGYVEIHRLSDRDEIQSLADLEGQTVGVQSLDASQTALLEAAINAETDLELDQVEFLATGIAAEAQELLSRGDIDALLLPKPNAVRLIELYDTEPISSDFLNSVGWHTAQVAPSAAVADNPDLYARFARGVARAVVFVEANPEAAINMHWDEVWPESAPNTDRDEVFRSTLAQIQARLENMQPVDGAWGGTDDASVQAYIDAVSAGGLESDVAIEDVWTGNLLEQINDFDEGEVVADAENSAG